MIWRVEKDGKKSFVVGTAHFFPYSFRTSLSRYIENAQTVLFEGPLDEDNMAKVVNAGFAKQNVPHLFEELDKQTIADIAQALAPPGRDRFPFLFLTPGTSSAENPVYDMIKGMKPWMAFFTIWRRFLEQKGWRYSVDLEAYSIAAEMGKDIVFLETIEEQIEVLEGFSSEKIVDFLKRIKSWNAYTQAYVKGYLGGDLANLRSITGDFPTRRFTVIEGRDRVLYERMLVYLEKGNAIACVGAPHIPGISGMLRSGGYQTLRQGTSEED